jgi:hypothetical protein
MIVTQSAPPRASPIISLRFGRPLPVQTHVLRANPHGSGFSTPLGDVDAPIAVGRGHPRCSPLFDLLADGQQGNEAM